MLEDPRQCYVLWGIEPDFDLDNPARAMRALGAAKNVIAVASHASDGLREVSNIILPLAPVPESEGSMVNLDGTGFDFRAAGKAGGDVRPGWKILRRLGSELGLDGFGQVDRSRLVGRTASPSDGTSLTSDTLIVNVCILELREPSLAVMLTVNGPGLLSKSGALTKLKLPELSILNSDASAPPSA